MNASFSTELGDESTAKTVEQKKAAAAPTGPGGSAGIGSDQGSASSVNYLSHQERVAFNKADKACKTTGQQCDTAADHK